MYILYRLQDEDTYELGKLPIGYGDFQLLYIYYMISTEQVQDVLTCIVLAMCAVYVSSSFSL